MYQVQCKTCKGKSKLNIGDDGLVTYVDQMPIISSRFRKDLAWGFECLCGNDTRLCKEELTGTPVEIKGSSKQVVDAVIDRMKLTPDDSFIMTEI